MRRKMLRMSDLLRLLVLVTILSVAGHAQFRAGLQGVVMDASGGTVAGATVTLTFKDTGQTQTATTNDEGFYRFSALAPGQYTLTVEQQGFKKRVVNDVRISAENVSGQDVTLEAGVISETVTVQAETTAIETENANIQKSITTQEVRNLPQVGRDPYELARLAPGVLSPGARAGNGNSVGLPNTTGPGGSNSSIFQSENQVPISASGQRLSQNNFQLDGVSVTSLQHGGAANITPNQESVKEVQVSSTSFSAEDGRNSGAQIKVVSQNGTNEFHGSAIFKYDTPAWNAFNKFPRNIGSGPQRVERLFRQFGGSVGGPLYLPRFGEGGPAVYGAKDRRFFFFSYEG
ncbi:MAG TPA: carboxypeptidase-like regulatory domain-containing protein, partial [Pyrinomonadaceae bacterium]|nr:carboxypeptidase-like regulatory domain-containing protein [Pyrinomonadaceae bacterium]